MESRYRPIELTAKDEIKLAYIQSNKFITLKSYHRKFLKAKTEVAAWYQLEKFCKLDPPFLERLRGNHFEERYYIPKPAALKYLDQKNLILVRSPRFQSQLRGQSYEHDCRVTSLRIALEENQDLKNIFWVSDFELRSGITPEIKAKFMEGRLNKISWRYNRNKEIGLIKQTESREGGPKNQYPRTPDGYFEADLEGRREAFVLEYIHQHYSRGVMDKMVYQLSFDPTFSKSHKLIVCRTGEDAEAVIPKLRERVKEKEKWFVGDYDRAVREPFKKIWFHLGE